MALLRAYFDLSGSEHDSVPITTVAGYLAPEAEWVSVKSNWQKELDDWELERFHATDLPRIMGHEKAQICLSRFLRIIEQSNLDAIGSALFNKDWDEGSWRGTLDFEQLDSYYEQCLDLALKCLGEFTAQNSPGEQVSVTCDRDAPIGVVDKIFKINRDKFEHIESAGVADSRDVLPLQCADLGAWSLRRNWVGFAEDDLSIEWQKFPRGRRSSAKIFSTQTGWIIAKSVNQWDRLLKAQRKSDHD